ncbi:class I SAM-dependent methyltransferase [Paraglaciecola sp. MB-3u-78]|uniref:class I SAM-dependent methyltransferase n=1 Tax=Paraglaciecola sp. MB-3u-78 TaxID=2058332 RepID=UPI000C325B29|nr:class I SAM-dependent methyltransferase [Paraglaciecola sp. MB-3u-78]PKH00357.1 SAM-dependent methyltransferase [Paraglaciecola sp. MB-3u-78]
MSYDKSVADHYLHGNLLDAIKIALLVMGKTIDTVTIEDLAAVDEFHVGGRLATEHLLKQLNFAKSSDLLDVGCGLGGAARYVALKHKHHVSGIDLALEYIETGKALCHGLNLERSVSLVQGSALSMPYQDNAFDGGFMLHVGMNIDDKVSLFTEIYRVLKPGAVFGVYDIMRQKDGELTYPVPWATDSSTSKLSTPLHYRQASQQAGFDIFQENNRRDFSLDFFKQLQVKSEAKGGLAPLGLHILMQQNAANNPNT